MTVKASIILITKRANPLIEKAIELLNKQTCLDFEYVVIDGYWFQRREEMEKIIKEQNPLFPIQYLPDKPTRWKGRRPALASAINTAWIWCKGDYSIHFDDCVVKMPEDLVEKHLKWLQQGFAVAGNWFTHPGNVYGWEHRAKTVSTAKIVDGSWLYGGHFSVPLDWALSVNGEDEQYDGEQGCNDCDLGIRLSRAGYRVVYDPSIYVEYDLATHTLTQQDHTFKMEWRKEGKPVEPKKRILKDGKEHFSNEFLIQQLAEEAGRIQPQGNNFNLTRLRKLPERFSGDILKVHEALQKYIQPDPRDWRDGALIEEMLKE